MPKVDNGLQITFEKQITISGHRSVIGNFSFAVEYDYG
jgi:hypothetical protein